MQKCYNCGKEVDDNVLICPDCGALVKRYGRPESAQPEQEADPFPRETAFDTQPQPRGAVWRQEDGKLKFSGYVTFWLVLCAIYLGNLLLSFAITLLVYRFRDFYFEILGQFEELAYMEEYLRQLLSIIEAEPIRLIVVGVLVAVQFGWRDLVPRVEAEAGVLYPGRSGCAAERRAAHSGRRHRRGHLPDRAVHGLAAPASQLEFAAVSKISQNGGRCVKQRPPFLRPEGRNHGGVEKKPVRSG